MKHCIKCNRKVDDLFESLYGETMCEYCWDDYLMTDKGKVEYLVGIVRGDYPMDYFDADFLGHVATCWRRYIYEINLTDDEMAEIEAKAVALGLL
jgi:DNA-directed RNA polymerase subunit RPC12/RpoP